MNAIFKQNARAARRALLTITGLIIAGSSVMGCSLFSTDRPPEPTAGTAPFTSPTTAPTPALLPTVNVAITWRVPKEPVEGFHLYFGHERESLIHTQRIELAELEKTDETPTAVTYQYILEKVDPKKPLFVSVASFEGDVVSPRSPLWEVVLTGSTQSN